MKNFLPNVTLLLLSPPAMFKRLILIHPVGGYHQQPVGPSNESKNDRFNAFC